MPVDKQVQLRYEVLNKCFRDLYREYTIDDLVDACNKAMLREFDMEDGVSKRTVQNDIANLQMPPYNIRLDENLKNGRMYHCTIVPFGTFILLGNLELLYLYIIIYYNI